MIYFNNVVPYIDVVATLTTTQLFAQRSEFTCAIFLYLPVGDISSEMPMNCFGVKTLSMYRVNRQQYW